MITATCGGTVCGECPAVRDRCPAGGSASIWRRKSKWIHPQEPCRKSRGHDPPQRRTAAQHGLTETTAGSRDHGGAPQQQRNDEATAETTMLHTGHIPSNTATAQRRTYGN